MKRKRLISQDKPHLYPIRVKVNGLAFEREAEARMLLVYFLRDILGLKGTHVGCDTTNCGACTVLLNGVNVKSCTMFAVQADGAEILTIEGCAKNGRLHPIQEAFWDNHGLQCGYCTPGLVLSGYALLRDNPDPTEEEIRKGISGHLCICTGYVNIINSIRAAAAKMKQ
ncbi:MAG: (2Fe-2S)-binding protein [Acidobacteria bacterium]|nr:(2Fe-2S)-binding protein [Acidobacteriota bacterium]